MKDYRKVWVEHNGPIPLDNSGRSYEVHHKDGNRNNNSIDNLVCVSIREHYDIHYDQGDWAACRLIAERMEIGAEEKKLLAEKNATTMVKEGTHPFLKENRKKYGCNGITSEDAKTRSEILVKENKHPFQKGNSGYLDSNLASERNSKRIDEGTHNFVGESNPSYGRIKKGTHNFVTNHPCKTKWKCEETGIVSTKTGFTRRSKKLGFDSWPHKLNKIEA